MTPFHLIFTEFDDLISIQSKEIGKNQNHPNLNFHDEILKIANNWLKNTPDEKNSIRHSENKLIQPLLTLIAKELEWKQSDYAFKLSKVMRDLKLEILQWDSAKGYNSAVFRSTGSKIREAYNKLQEANSYFQKNTKTTSVFRINNCAQ